MPLLCDKQQTEEWKAARKGRITASMAAACLGQHPHHSRQKAWRIITGLETVESNWHISRGVKLESWAIQQYELETGLLAVPTGFFVHPELDWLGASPDGLVGDYGLLEAKCPHSIYPAIPEHYRIQCLVQLAVTERKWADFFAITDRREKFMFRVEPSLKEQDAIVGQLLDFYNQYVKTGVCPPRRRNAK